MAPARDTQIRSLTRLAAVSMACAVVGLPQGAWALGMGSPRTLSALGQPLNLLFPITLGSDEHLDPDCVHVDVLAGEAHVPPSQVKFRLEGDADGRLRWIRVLSLVRMDEPVVSTTVTLGCPTSVTRQFVAFMDPPDVQTADVPVDAQLGREVESGNYSPAVRAALATSNNRPQDVLAATPAPSAPTPTPTPAVVAAASPPPAPRPERAASGPAVPASAPKAAATPPAASGAAPALAQNEPAKPSVRKKAHKPAHPEPTGPAPAVAAAASTAASHAPQARLHLDAPEAPVQAPVAVAPASAASALGDEARLIAQLDRIETEVGKVRKDNLALQARVHTLQGELDAAESARYSNPLVWILALAAVLLGGVCAYLVIRMRQMARAPQWWQAPRAGAAAERAEPIAPKTPAASAPAVPTPGLAPPVPPQTAPSRPIELAEERHTAMLAPVTVASDPEPVTGGDSILETTPAALLAEPATMLQFADTRPGEFTKPAAPPVDEPMTVEELLDMQQQVEFFLVLGQHQAAIELLEARIATGASSALPYLKLMEIYQHQGDALSFADIAGRFSARFNALAPTWGTDLNKGRALEDYPNALVAIQRGWHDAAPSMLLIQNLLTYGDREFATDLTAPEAMSGAHGAGFDLPAYRDLLALYSVARDLSEQEVRGGDIDLFLPLDGGAGAETGTSMMATMVWRNVPPHSSFAMPVDIPLDDAPVGEAGSETTIDPSEAAPGDTPTQY